jgi:regulator of protease activity HflC (stomatin/prohibitin superfamily)
MEILGGIIVLTLLMLLSGLKIVKEHNRLVVFRCGKVIGSKGPGMHMVVPLIDRAHTVDTRIVTAPIPPMEVVTKDHRHVKVSAVCMTQIVDAAKALTKMTEPEVATLETVQAVLAATLHHHTLKELLHDRQHIAHILKKELSRRTKQWGIQIKSFELKEIDLPMELRESPPIEDKQYSALEPQNHNGSNHETTDSTYKYHHDELQKN